MGVWVGLVDCVDCQLDVEFVVEFVVVVYFGLLYVFGSDVGLYWFQC